MFGMKFTTEQINKAPKYSAVYQIIDMDSGRRYVGSATNVRHRWGEHVRQLNAKIHCNRFMQRAWDKRGDDRLQFEILERCKKEDLLDVEQRFIDDTNPEMNLVRVAGSMFGYRFTEEQKKRLSDAHKGKRSGMKGKRHTEAAKHKNRIAHLGRRYGPVTEEKRDKLRAAQTRIHKESRKRRANRVRVYAEMSDVGRANISKARATLTPEQIREIRRLYAEGNLTQKEIGALFGISRVRTTKIVNRVQYKWVD